MAAVAADDPRIDLFGFARLVGDGIDYVIKKYEVVLGRASKSGQTDVVLGDNMNISRQHARIVYNAASKAFELMVLGKNGVTVGTTLYTPASAPCVLKSQDMLAVGEKVFYFLLPKPPAAITKQDLEQLHPNHPANKRPRLSDALAGAPAALPGPGGLAAGGAGGLGAGGAIPQATMMMAGGMPSLNALPRGPPGMPPLSGGLFNAAAAAAAAQGMLGGGLRPMGPGGTMPLMPAGSSGQQSVAFLLQQQQQQQQAAAAAAAAQGGANGALLP